MIRDTSGDELTYWPVTGLRAGEDSDPLNIVVDTPQEGVLRATLDADLTVWGRIDGSGDPFTDLTNDGYDLSGLSGPETEFEIYVSAGTGITSVERVALTIGPVVSSPAGWTL